MQFAVVALLASVASAARLPGAPLVGRSAATVSVTGTGDASALLAKLTRPETQACAGGPVALAGACHAAFRCSEAAAADPAVLAAAADRLASAVGPVTQSCVCTCGTYCCPLCNFAVPEAVQVKDLGFTVTCA